MVSALPLSVFNALPDAGLLLAPDLTVVAANDAYLAATHTRRETLVGQNILAAFPDNPAAPELAASLAQVQRTGQPHQTPPLRYPSAPARYWQARHVPVPDEQGQLAYILHLLSELPAQVSHLPPADAREVRAQEGNEELRAANAALEQAGQALRELNQQLEARAEERTQALQEALREAQAQREQVQVQELTLQQILGQVPAAVATLLGPEHRYAFFNKPYQVLAGGRPRLGHTVAEVLPEVLAQGFVKLLDEVYSTGKPYLGVEVPVQLLNAAGQPEQRYVDLVYQPMIDEGGIIQGILAFIVDTTQKVKSQQQAAQAEADAQATTAQLAAQRESFFQVFAQTPACIAILRGPEHQFEFVNAPYQQLFPGRQLLGRPLIEALPETAEYGFVKLLDQVYQTGEPYFGAEMPLQITAEDGSLLPEAFFTFTYQAYQEQGQPVGVSIFAFDVTEQVRARQEAAVHQAQLQALFEQAPVAVAIFRGPDYLIEVANVLVAQLWGRTPEEVVGRPLLEALPEVRDQGFKELMDEVVATGSPFVAQEVAAQLLRNGRMETVYLNFVYQPLRDASGHISSVAVVATEVSGQVAARKASEASARQLRLLTDALPVLIGYLDLERRYRFANRAYQAWFNLDPAELLGRPVWEVVGEAAYQATQGYMARALAGEQVDFEARMPYREGFVRHIRTSYIPDVQQDKVAGFYTLVTDITEQVLAREQVQAANTELAAANQELTRTNQDLDNFVYAASHDLKQPVNNLSGLFEELYRSIRFIEPEEEQVLVPLIQQALHQLSVTIDDLAMLGQTQQAGKAPGELVLLAELTEEVLNVLEPQMRAAQARITTDFAAWPTLAYPRANLRTVLLNLLSNSLKYADPARPARIHLSVWVDAGQPVLMVEDNGLGFDAEKYGAELFQLFRRLHQHTSGSGVGLYLVNRIVQANGGRIEVDSQEGEGATFRIWLGRSGE
ncbi:PAS domain-containing protein [Hymenobacter lutimineralis]|nr:PAS domain-containing protein [Hymenobacter lutimineralis]